MRHCEVRNKGEHHIILKSIHKYRIYGLDKSIGMDRCPDRSPYKHMQAHTLKCRCDDNVSLTATRRDKKC